MLCLNWPFMPQNEKMMKIGRQYMYITPISSLFCMRMPQQLTSLGHYWAQCWLRNFHSCRYCFEDKTPVIFQIMRCDLVRYHNRSWQNWTGICYIKSVISEHLLQIIFMGTPCEIGPVVFRNNTNEGTLRAIIRQFDYYWLNSPNEAPPRHHCYK